ncbi:GNAT family N-acetyltransferase [bacterium AH-315-K05]|nr:GNAT family N-acetyltransferase [bacterium AH-315-K05]MBN4074689.1 GNAT family N-acetyltransferase [bacterium AH-315-E09]
MKKRNEFTLKHAKQDDCNFISEMIDYSNKNIKAELGYPRCDDLEELLAEIEVYENLLEESICIIYHNEKPIAIGGFLYTPGESDGYLIGPIVLEKYYQKSNIIKMIDLMLNSKKNLLADIRTVVSERNSLLHESLLENAWIYSERIREMRFDLENIKRSPVKYEITEVDVTGSVHIDTIFKLFDKTFGWKGDFEKMEELLGDSNKVACIADKTNSIIGVVAWSYLDDTNFSRLEYVAVEENQRRKGIGENLINHVINDGINNKMKHIYLSTDIDNNAADLYGKIGFYDTIVSKVYKKRLSNNT